MVGVTTGEPQGAGGELRVRRAGARRVSVASGLGRANIAEIQRARILSAMLEVLLEHGAGSVSVAHVVERSGISRRTFYEIFRDRDECFLTALDDAIDRAATVVVPVFEGSGRWRERVRLALTDLLAFFDGEPALARLLIVESLAAGSVALERRNRVLARLIAVVDQGRSEASEQSEPSPLTAEGVVGAVCSIIHGRLSDPAGTALQAQRVEHPRTDAGGCEPLVSLTGELMGMIVLPYLGRAAANRELHRPVSPSHTVLSATDGYPFRELGMRLTYRTVRVLEAVASNPDASNRLLGQAAGIGDQGQISKLLSRLQRLGLLQNTADTAGKGTPNAWRLTSTGRRVTHTIHTHAKNTDTEHSSWA